MTFNPFIHHRKSIRLKDYDYSMSGLYFITICCNDRMCIFGEIINGDITLNNLGNSAKECWLEIPDHFPNAILHEFIIMPNHVHGIIELINLDSVKSETSHVNKFQKMIPNSIGSIVKGFKIGVTKWARKNSDIITVWQRNYHEHIIKNQISYHNISSYIVNNPQKWQDDKFYK